MLAILAAVAAVSGQELIAFHHLYTFGSKLGIHPPGVLNKKPAVAVFGEREHPFGIEFPAAVTTDIKHRVWITDRITASIQIYDPKTGSYKEIKKLGNDVLQQPWGITSDPQGRVFVVDSPTGALYAFDENGEFDRVVVKPSSDVLKSPGVIALSEDGKTIYVADLGRNLIVEVNREGEVNETITLPPELAEPVGLAVAHNQIYVLGNRQHKIGIFSPAGRQRGEIHWDDAPFPTAFTYDPLRRRFLAMNTRLGVVEIFDENGKNLSLFGQRGDGVDQMHRVDFMHVDPEGLIYLVDSTHGKVLVFGESSPH